MSGVYSDVTKLNTCRLNHTDYGKSQIKKLIIVLNQVSAIKRYYFCMMVSVQTKTLRPILFWSMQLEHYQKVDNLQTVLILKVYNTFKTAVP